MSKKDFITKQQNPYNDLLCLTQFQENIIKEIFSNINQGNLHISLAMPPGSGKSTMLPYIAQKLIHQGKSVLIIADTTILKGYFETKFSELCLDNYVIKTATQYSKENVCLDDYDTILLDNLRAPQRYKLRNSDADFSKKIVISFITPGQELKGEEQGLPKNIDFNDNITLKREIPESISPYIIPTGNILDIRDSFLAAKDEKENLAIQLKNCIEREYHIDKCEENTQSYLGEGLTNVKFEGFKKKPVNRTPLMELLCQSLAKLSSGVNGNLSEHATLGIANIITEPIGISISVIKYILNKVKQYNEKNPIDYTYEHYSEVLKENLSEPVWDKLSRESRNFLISGMMNYEMKKAEAEKHDFSGICVELSKSLDVEMTKRIYKQYVEYLKNKYDDYDKWPQALIFNNKILNEEKFTLGTVIYVIGHGKYEILNNSDYKNFLNYALEVLYNRDLTLNDIKDNITVLCNCVETVRKKYRNLAAHRDPIDHIKAKECIEYLITDKQMLKKILEDMAY